MPSPRLPSSRALARLLAALLAAALAAGCGVRGPESPLAPGAPTATALPAPEPGAPPPAGTPGLDGTELPLEIPTLTPSPPPFDTPDRTAEGADASATPTPAAADQATLTPSPPPIDSQTAASPTPTPAAAAQSPCAFTWAYAEAPGVPERARRALEDAGLSPAEVSAQTFGESCGSRFLPMGTTVTAELPVGDLADLEALGEIVARATAALSTLGETPGPEPEARLIFRSGAQTSAITFALRVASDQIARGVTGARLLEALGYRP